ncbi:MAG: DUF3871 family protein [Bacteroidota bacterium]
MEIVQAQSVVVPAIEPKIIFPATSTDKPFILANTQETNFHSLKFDCIIPVFAKDNETTISHNQFIEAVMETASQFYQGETILDPVIRVSHAIKGRIPEAMGKPAHMLRDDEKTIYYERMAFVIEIPSIYETVEGNPLSLCIGGVRAYNHENLYGKKTAEKFKVFVGFQNKVCCNLCISTDGIKVEIKARTLHELAMEVFNLFASYDPLAHVQWLSQLPDSSMTESLFAKLIGRLKMYPYLPNTISQGIPDLELGDSQLSMVVKDYYQDESFCRESNGNINLWRLFNLFTGANKSSYIDRFLDRNVNVSGFVEGLKMAVNDPFSSWYLS